MEDLASGTWTLQSKDENFDKFLVCREARWFLRTMISTMPNADVEFVLSKDKKTITKKTYTSVRNSVYPMAINEDFVPERTLSGRKEIGRIFETSGRKVIQEMRFDKEETPIATIERHVVDNKMFVKMKCKDIVSEEVYVKKEVSQ